MQFSLKFMLFAVTFIAVTFCSLTFANEIVASLFFTFFFLMLCLGILLAIFQTNEKRARWAGFSIVALVYALFLIGTDSKQDPALRYLSISQRSELITTKLLKLAYSEICVNADRNTSPNRVLGIPTPRGLSASAKVELEKAYQHFYTIGQSFFAVVFGWLGGIVATKLYWGKLSSNKRCSSKSQLME